MTLGLLRALADKGEDIGAAKTGPDYIDCAFLAAASRTPAVNLDCHAMPQALIRRLAAERPRDMLVIEGVMGLFDGTWRQRQHGSLLQPSKHQSFFLDTRHRRQPPRLQPASKRRFRPGKPCRRCSEPDRLAAP